MNLADALKQTASRVEGLFETLIPASQEPVELSAAMRHALLAGGKRVRPYLCVEAYSLIAPPSESIYYAAAAIEMVHTFSLIHDDLPALDNDDLRRGQPTVHVKYGESTAILAGDALLAMAFDVLSQPHLGTAEQRVTAVRMLAAACGPAGMVGGQIDDISYEGKPLTGEQLQHIHVRKTGALLEASVGIGLTFAGAGPDDIERLVRYAHRIGLAFQIVDDILDVTGDTATLGKPAGSDLGLDKATYPKIFGLDGAKQMALTLTSDAKAALAPYGEKASRLNALADYLLTRSY
jgi:geranylgeranyl diphosphate synthase type II